MKKLLLIFLALIITYPIFSQEFKFDQNGLTPNYQVVEIDSMSQKELFDKAINWIKENYVNPDEVIKTTIDDEKVRFTGAKENYLCSRILGIASCLDTRYTIELAFKDGKYKLEPMDLEAYNPGNQYMSPGWYPVLIGSNAEQYYRKDKIRKAFRDYPEEIESLFNDLNKSLKLYLTQEQSVKEEKW